MTWARKDLNLRLPPCEDGTLTAELRAPRCRLLLRLIVFYAAFGLFFQGEIWRAPFDRIEARVVSPDSRDGDAYFHVWNLWYVSRTLGEGAWPYLHTDKVFAPVGGASLRFHSAAPVRTLLSAPLIPLLGPVFVMNAWALVSFVLAGVGMALLVRRETGSEDAGFLAGLAWTASAYHLFHFVRLDVQAIEFLPFLVYFLRRGNPVLAGLAWLWGGLSAWYYVALGGVALAVYGVGAGWRRFAVATVVFGVLVSPFLLPVVLATPPRAALLTLEQASSNSLDLAALLLPSSEHALWGRFCAPLLARMNGYEQPAWAIGATGIAGLLALLVGRGVGTSLRRPTLLLAGFGLLVAIGPHIRFLGPVTIGGEPVIWAPYLLLYKVPLFGGLRAVVRWALFVDFAAVVGFGCLVAMILSKRPGAKWAILAILVLDLLRFPEVVGIPPSSAAVEKAIREDPRSVSVLSIPPTETPTDIQLFQVRHTKPVVIGAITHVQEATRDELFLTYPDLHRFQTPSRLGAPDSGIDARLAAGGIGWIALHKGTIEEIPGSRAAGAAKVRRFLVASLGEPTAEDARIAAWRIGK